MPTHHFYLDSRLRGNDKVILLRKLKYFLKKVLTHFAYNCIIVLVQLINYTESDLKGKKVQIRVSTNDGIPIYLQIINQIKYMVASGRLEPGDKLPPVRKLAEQLLVNPNTVARAYRELEAANVLNTRQGSGVFVSDGVSPLAKREQKKILRERIDLLLAEAKQMNISMETVIELIQQQSEHIK